MGQWQVVVLGRRAGLLGETTHSAELWTQQWAPSRMPEVRPRGLELSRKARAGDQGPPPWDTTGPEPLEGAPPRGQAGILHQRPLDGNADICAGCGHAEPKQITGPPGRPPGNSSQNPRSHGHLQKAPEAPPEAEPAADLHDCPAHVLLYWSAQH